MGVDVVRDERAWIHGVVGFGDKGDMVFSFGDYVSILLDED